MKRLAEVPCLLYPTQKRHSSGTTYFESPLFDPLKLISNIASRIVDIWAFPFAPAGAGSTGQSVQYRREACKLHGFLLLPLLLLRSLKKISFTFLWNEFPFLSSPTAGRTACPAREVAANKTAPPPMIPKLLTVMKNINFKRSKYSLYHLQGNHSCRWKRVELAN